MKEEEFEMDPSIEDRISLEASAWIAKGDEGFTAEEQDAFFEWLAQDERHRAIYAERLEFWREMDDLSDWRPGHSLKPNPDLLAYRPERRRRLWIQVGLGLAAVLAVGFLMFNALWERNQNETRILAFGGAKSYENHVLDDGSIVELNTGAAVSVQYTWDRRLIFLHSGEAHFMVAKDAKRPFQVRAQSALVQATGTAFNVSVEENGIEVLVTEGKVLVEEEPPSDDIKQADLRQKLSRELVAGQVSVLSSSQIESEPVVSSVSWEEIDSRLAWKGEDLDFDAAPLSQVATELNRRNRIKIAIRDRALEDLPITAKIRSNKLDSFVELLEVAMNVEADRSDPDVITLRASKQSVTR